MTKHVWAVLSWVVVAALPAAAQVVPMDFEISCAAFPTPPSEADLRARFGAERLVLDSIVGADDGPFLGGVLFSDDPERRVDIAWSDDARSEASWLRVRGSGWSTAHGLRVGDALREVEARNGWPFRLAGFWGEGWYGGHVLNWGRGRLDALRDDECREHIVFQPPYDGTAPFDALRQVRSLREVSSGHPAMQRVNPRVVSIWLVYPRLVTH